LEGGKMSDMAPLPPTREPQCVICNKSIRVGDRTVFLDGDLAHQGCSATPDELADRIEDFLYSEPAGLFCNVCIARTCSLPYQHVAKTMVRLRAVRLDLRLMIGARCSGCGNIRITIGVRPVDETLYSADD